MLSCIGVGKPTVILDAGWSDLSVEWRKVQPEIAKFAKVCFLRRAGYGGSGPGPIPLTSVEIATELHALLRNAGEQPPYVLVGFPPGKVRKENPATVSLAIGIGWVAATRSRLMLPTTTIRFAINIPSSVLASSAAGPSFLGGCGKGHRGNTGATATAPNPTRKNRNISGISLRAPGGALANSFHTKTPHIAEIMVAPWPIA